MKTQGDQRYKLVVSNLDCGDDRLAGLKMIGAMRQRQMRVPVVIYTVRPQDPAGGDVSILRSRRRKYALQSERRRLATWPSATPRHFGTLNGL
jgi:hypothetical protein